MAGRYNPLNIDESKIVKKEELIQNEPEIVKIDAEPVIQKPTQSQSIDLEIEESKQIEESIKESVIQPVIQSQKEISKKGEEYLNIIKDYVDNNGNIIREQLSDRKEDINNILKQTYQQPKIPVYKYGKDLETGKITIESKKNEEQKNELKEQTNNTNNLKDNIVRQEIIKMLDDTNRNIIRTKIELKIHIELLRSVSDEKKKDLYEAKIKAYKDDLDYFNQRKSILERM